MRKTSGCSGALGTETARAEIDWLKGLTFVRTSFCKNLHAKCCLSEEACIVTSLNLYEFSMVNNNEMGVLVNRAADVDLYREAYDEAQRIIRISEEVRISLERVEPERPRETPKDFVAGSAARNATAASADATPAAYEKLTTAKLASTFGMQTKELLDRLTATGMLEIREGRHYLTEAGKRAGGEWRPGQGGGYMLWPGNMSVG